MAPVRDERGEALGLKGVELAHLMPYTLWRNDVLLGELVVPFHSSSPDLISGMLRLTAAYADVMRVMQARVPTLTDPRVHLRRFTGEGVSGPVAARQLKPGELTGAPLSEQFELRDDHGQSVPTDMIMIEPIGIPEGSGEFPDACREAGLKGSGWSIVAHRVDQPGR